MSEVSPSTLSASSPAVDHTLSAPAAPQAVDLKFSVATLAWAAVLPLWHRLGRGEGLLLAVNLSIILVGKPTVADFLLQSLVSTAVLVALYQLNDLFDCERDLNDPGKNQHFVRFCVKHQKLLGLLLAGEHALLAGIAYLGLGPSSALAVIAVFLVNFLYSASLKGRAVIDVPWVALWGALYAMVVGVVLPIALYITVGLMTGIAHVFQITRDRDVDTVNGVRTSAVAIRWMPVAQMTLLCLGIAACIAPLLGLPMAATALIPLFLFVALRSNQTAWLVAKGYYGIMWLLMLNAVYVTH